VYSSALIIKEDTSVIHTERNNKKQGNNLHVQFQSFLLGFPLIPNLCLPTVPDNILLTALF